VNDSYTLGYDDVVGYSHTASTAEVTLSPIKCSLSLSHVLSYPSVLSTQSTKLFVLSIKIWRLVFSGVILSIN